MNGADRCRNAFSDRLLSRRPDGGLFVCQMDWKTACITKDDETQSPVTVHLLNSLMYCSSRYQLTVDGATAVARRENDRRTKPTRSDTHG